MKIRLIHDMRLGEKPFWMTERGFKPLDIQMQVHGTACDVWEKSFEAGRIGLGVSSLRDEGYHYGIAISPQNKADKLEMTEFYPGMLRVGVFEKGARFYSDWNVRIEEFPDQMKGWKLLCPMGSWSDFGNLLDFFRTTQYPAKMNPIKLH